MATKYVRAVRESTLVLLAALAILPAPGDAGRVGMTDARACVLPVVALPDSRGADYALLGNALLLDEDGHAVAPAHVFRELDTSLLLPVPRIGVLVPKADEAGSGDVARDRVFLKLRVEAIDDGMGLALLRVEGNLRKAAPVKAGAALDLGEPAHVFGFGGPGVLPHLFRASVAARLPAPAAGKDVLAYALDATVTAAAHGGILFDRVSGKVSGLAFFHLRNVHRVVTKHADFEYGPTGTATALPLAAVKAWATKVKVSGS